MVIFLVKEICIIVCEEKFNPGFFFYYPNVHLTLEGNQIIITMSVLLNISATKYGTLSADVVFFTKMKGHENYFVSFRYEFWLNKKY